MANRMPSRAADLFRDLVAEGADVTASRVSEGISTLSQHLAELRSDIEILVGHDRLSRAAFLLSAAEEELAKVFILLDLMRIDTRKHGDQARALCGAFYDHVRKYAYLAVQRWEGLRDMRQAKELFELETKKWFPADPESGEPDMPHDTVFLREMNLYVDFIHYDQRWWLPGLADSRDRFTESAYPHSWDAFQQDFDALGVTVTQHLTTPEALSLLNNHFRSVPISESTDISVVDETHQRLYRDLHQLCAVTAEDFRRSLVPRVPLYAFV